MNLHYFTDRMRIVWIYQYVIYTLIVYVYVMYCCILQYVQQDENLAIHEPS